MVMHARARSCHGKSTVPKYIQPYTAVSKNGNVPSPPLRLSERAHTNNPTPPPLAPYYLVSSSHHHHRYRHHHRFYCYCYCHRCLPRLMPFTSTCLHLLSLFNSVKTWRIFPIWTLITIRVAAKKKKTPPILESINCLFCSCLFYDRIHCQPAIQPHTSPFPIASNCIHQSFQTALIVRLLYYHKHQPFLLTSQPRKLKCQR